MDFAAKRAEGLSYTDFLATHGNDEQRRRWAAVYGAVRLSDAQRSLLASFKREMPVFCLAGAWCGDCVNQCPIFEHFASACPQIKLLYFDRDQHPDLATELRVCGAARVPAVQFLSEDFEPIGRYGDRTLSKYRQMASELTGATCPTGLVVPERSTLDAVTQEWLNEFERCQLILRTSARLRKIHND
jgi:hypothetical protein